MSPHLDELRTFHGAATASGGVAIGLPREPDAFHGLPWSQVPRS